MKTSELIGPALDWAVCKSGGGKASTDYREVCAWLDGHSLRGMFNYSTNWAQGGPIIEREGIELLCNLTATEAAQFKDAHADWQAFYRLRRDAKQRSFGTTPLVAAMRCYVASKLGDEVDIPPELTNQ
jgi:hypothetical protein